MRNGFYKFGLTGKLEGSLETQNLGALMDGTHPMSATRTKSILAKALEANPYWQNFVEVGH